MLALASVALRLFVYELARRPAASSDAGGRTRCDAIFRLMFAVKAVDSLPGRVKL